MRPACLLPVMAAVLLAGCGQRSQSSAQTVASQRTEAPGTRQPLPVNTAPQQTVATTEAQQTKLPEQTAQQQPAGQQPAPKRTTEPEPANAATVSGVARVMERPEVQNDMKQLALFYRNHEAGDGPVKSQEAFMEYIKRDAPARILQQMDALYYVVVPNLRNPGSTTVVAFERIADRSGQHVVAMGDGSVHQMTTAALRAALKGQ